MKTFPRKHRREQGSALLISIVIGTIMLLSLASYLTLVDHQTHMSNRSQAWNTTISVAEAGIEEALEHINANYNLLATEGWGFDGTCYVMDYDLGNGSGYSVSIDPTSDPFVPKITSRGVTMVRGGAVIPIFGVLGMEGSLGDVPIARAIRVHVTRGNLFIKAMVAKESIFMNGNNILTDSYDSGDPAKSTNNKYDSAKAGNNGDVAVNSSILNGINVGNANIYGRAATGPNGTVAVGSNGGVGERSWQALHPGGTQPGWVTDDMNFTFPETALPYRVGLEPRPGDVITAEAVVTATPQTNTPPPGVTADTNFVIISYSTNYPGALEGLVTNLVWETSSTPPGHEMGSIITNSIRHQTAEWPGTGFGEVTTNSTMQTSMTYPSVQGKPITTNYIMVTESGLPTPLPTGTIITNTTVSKIKQAPKEGTYLGEPQKEPNSPWWIYNLIVGYSWFIPQYSWPEYGYVYYKYSYTYQRAYYGVPDYSFTWTQYTTNYIYTTNHYDHVLDVSGANYIVSALSGKTYVAADVNLVVLYDIRMSGQDVIEIGPYGKLHAWVDGTSSSVSGNGVINKTGLPANCIIEFTPNVATVSCSGNGEFIGVLLAADSALELDGGGSSDTDFCGAVVANTVNMRGHFKFHYDEALGRLAGNGRFLITYWDEVNPDTAFGTP